MSTRAMRLKTQARVLACLQVVFLRFQMSKNNPFLKAWLGLKRIVPIISVVVVELWLKFGVGLPANLSDKACAAAEALAKAGEWNG